MADPQVQANDEQEIAEAQNSLVDLLYDVVAQAATTRLGAFVYRRIDSVLSTVEKTAKWSLPQPAPTAPAPAQPAQEGPAPAEDGGDPNANPNPDANNAAGTGKISAPPLVRPLPWMLFLPALIVMRLVRIGLSLLALMVGRPPVRPASVVHFIQNKRRKLRALKYRGQKLNRISRAEAKAEDELQTTWLSRITMPLRRIVCRSGRVVVTPHRHHHHRHQANQQQNHQQQQQQQQQGQQDQQQDQQPGRKRNAHERDIDDDSEVDESTVNELLDKYADADGDSSYHADSGSSDSSDTSLSEQEKSAVEDGPSKPPPAEPSSSSSTAKKESNGHGPKEGSQARRKSDLNVEADPKPKPAENGSVDGAKKQEGAKEPAIKESEKAESKDAKPKATENGPSDGSKNQDAAKEERQKSESTKPKPNPPASGSESADSKQTSAAGQKNQQEEDAAKNQSTSDAKSNSQQKNKQQPQQQQNQPQNQPQHANANGGNAGKKQKRPSQGHQ